MRRGAEQQPEKRRRQPRPAGTEQPDDDRGAHAQQQRKRIGGPEAGQTQRGALRQIEQQRQLGQQDQQGGAVHEAGQHRLRHHTGQARQAQQRKTDLQCSAQEHGAAAQGDDPGYAGRRRGCQPWIGSQLGHQRSQRQRGRRGQPCRRHAGAAERCMDQAAEAGGHERRQQGSLRREARQRRVGQQTEREQHRQNRQRAGAPGQDLANPTRGARGANPGVRGDGWSQGGEVSPIDHPVSPGDAEAERPRAGSSCEVRSVAALARHAWETRARAHGDRCRPDRLKASVDLCRRYGPCTCPSSFTRACATPSRSVNRP
jgi:hypothetical protein